MKASYPLEPALAMREEQVEQAKQGLARSIEDLEQATVNLEKASQQLEHHRLETATLQQAEQHRVLGGSAAHEILTARAFFSRRKDEEAGLLQGVQEATRRQLKAEELVEQAREALAFARAELQAVTRHKETWSRTKAEEAQKKEDAEIDDLITSRRE